MNRDNSYDLIQAGGRIFTILDSLKELDGAGVTAVADHTGFSKSLVHKYLKTLTHHGYVVKNGHTYRLSFKFMNYSEYVRSTNPLSVQAEPKLDSLASKVDDAIILTVAEHGKGTFVSARNHERYFQNYPLVGRTHFLNHSAAGKAILARFGDEEIQAIIDEHGLPSRQPNTVTTREHLFEEIETIRDRGYAIAIGEWNPKVNGISAAVVHEASQTHGAISITGPAVRLSRERLVENYEDDILRVTGELEVQFSE